MNLSLEAVSNMFLISAHIECRNDSEVCRNMQCLMAMVVFRATTVVVHEIELTKRYFKFNVCVGSQEWIQLLPRILHKIKDNSDP